MEKILKFIKQAKKSDLEQLKLLCEILVREIQTSNYDDQVEEIEQLIIQEMELEI